MEGQRRYRQTPPRIVNHQDHQPWTLESQGTRHLCNHCQLCLERCSSSPGLCRPEALLRHQPHRHHGHPRHHLNRFIRLRSRRYLPSYHRVARRLGLLEYPTHCQDSSRSTLAGGQVVEAYPSLLVRLYGNVFVSRRFSKAYLRQR